MGEHERLLIEEEDGNFEGVAAAREKRVVDEIFEWQLLVLVGAERPGLHLGEQAAEGDALLKPQAHHLNVHEEADQVLGVFGAVGAGRADGEVVLAGEAMEHGGEDGEQQDVERDIFADAEGVRAGLEIGRDEQRFNVAGEGVEALGQRGQRVGIAWERDAAEVVAERLAPKIERARGLVGGEPVLLPDGEVCELDGDFRQCGGAAPDSAS